MLLATLTACSAKRKTLPPYGELVVEVDTELQVPTDMGRLRVDLFDLDGTWFGSRDFSVTNPDELPLSFSLFSESATESTDVLVRLRAYPEGKLRDYRGERFQARPQFSDAFTPHTLAETCDEATLLPIGKPRSVRVGGDPLVGKPSLSCDSPETRSGIAALKFTVAKPGNYRIEVTDSAPGAEWAEFADPMMSLRTDCMQADTEFACNDDLENAFTVAPGLTRELDPGPYYVLIANAKASPMDLVVSIENADTPEEFVVPPVHDQPNTPRWIVDNADLTPSTEPQPDLTIDRLARLRVEPEEQQTVHILLRGDCIGTMADLEERRSCFDTEAEQLPLGREPIVEGHRSAPPSRGGSWRGYLTENCSKDVTADDPDIQGQRACIPGGHFILGDSRVLGAGAELALPERMVVISPFHVDEDEYTVQRYRYALEHGFTPPDQGPTNNLEPLHVGSIDSEACTWNADDGGAAVFPERERMPLTCVTWTTARALCQFAGGDLPTSAEREYLAGAVGRKQETIYPTGNVEPDCSSMAFGRSQDALRGNSECAAAGALGPVAIDQAPWMDADRITLRVGDAGLGPDVFGLGGNVAEWTLDSHRAYDDDCWRSQPIRNPCCWESEAPLRTIAGASWRDDPSASRSAARRGAPPSGFTSWIGFRCVYLEDPSAHECAEREVTEEASVDAGVSSLDAGVASP